MKRVMIIGQPGSGKSTLARALAAKTGLPIVHLDHIHWKSGWVERPLHEKIPMVRAAEEQACWIIEGGLSATWETRLARADTLIWLDVGLLRRALRVVRRSWRYRGQSRPDLPNGCPEAFDRGMLVFLSFILRTWRPGKRRMKRVHAAYPRRKVVLRSVWEVESWLAAL